jgi:hypothetical protein
VHGSRQGTYPAPKSPPPFSDPIGVGEPCFWWGCRTWPLLLSRPVPLRIWAGDAMAGWKHRNNSNNNNSNTRSISLPNPCMHSAAGTGTATRSLGGSFHHWRIMMATRRAHTNGRETCVCDSERGYRQTCAAQGSVGRSVGPIVPASLGPRPPRAIRLDRARLLSPSRAHEETGGGARGHPASLCRVSVISVAPGALSIRFSLLARRETVKNFFLSLFLYPP